MKKEEIYQGLRDSGYTEKQIEKLLTSELTEEQYEQLIEAKAEKVNVDNKSGILKFIKVNHCKRAEKFGRLSDGDTTKYMNIALKYFDNRCALSGEEFKSFKEGNVKNSKAKSNLSAEHVIALCQGGNDVFPNLVPTVLQYNISKNGYYLLDWWNKQKNSDQTQTLYSPYRLLKLVNYMMKSLDARNRDLSIKEYEKAILTPNEIDEFLDGIEQQDKEETDNSKRKLISDVVTTVEIDEEDEKKILQTIPEMEGNIPKQSEQQREKDDDTMMDIFLYDSIKMLKEDEELVRHEEYEQLMKCLDKMYEKTRGVIPFEIEARNKILDKLDKLGVKENKYTVANELLQNTEILKITRENKEGIEEYLSQYFEEKGKQLATELELTEEQIQTAIINVPSILYDDSITKKIEFYKEYRPNHLENYLCGKNNAMDDLIDVLVVLKVNGIDLKIKRETIINDLIQGETEEKQKTILKELGEISGKIQGNWPIGRRISSYKIGNLNKLQKEIKNAGIELTKEERKRILEKETNQELSERKMQEFVQVLKILKTNGVELKIKYDTIINDLIQGETKEKQKKILKELEEISEEIQGNWLIGRRISNYKMENLNKLQKEIKNAGIELTEEEKKCILEKKTRKEISQELSERKTQEIVQVLKILKINGIDLKIKRETIINDLIQGETKEKQKKILKELEEISEEISEEIQKEQRNWRIGLRFSTQKNRNMDRFQEEIEKIGIELTKEEKKCLLEKETKQELSERKMQEFVQVLKILKTNGIDLKIKYDTIIDDLIQGKTKEKQKKILKELGETSEEIQKEQGNWRIGLRLRPQKNKNMDRFQEEIEKIGIELTKEEKKCLLEKETKQESSERKMQKIVQVLKILKTNGIDLKIKYDTIINDLIQGETKEKQKKILKELEEISEEIQGNWPIGRRISYYKMGNLNKLQKEIKNAGIELTEERKRILEKETNQELSERKTQEIVQVLKILKTNGIELKIKYATIINDLIQGETEEKQKKILKELEEISEEIQKEQRNWPIGIRISSQKDKNMNKLQEEIKKTGIVLTEEERKYILQKETKQELSERKTQEFVQVLEILKINGIDLKIKRGTIINDLIQGETKEKQKKILKRLGEISEEIQEEQGSWLIGIRLKTQKAKNMDKLQKEIEKVLKNGVQFTEEEIHILLNQNRGKDTSKSDEVIEFMRKIVVEQKQAEEIGDNRIIEETFNEDFKYAEYSKERESGDRK